MKTRIILLLALIGLATFAFVPIASADPADEGKSIEGKGMLYAKGAGTARVRGDGGITIQAHGVGSVWIKGAESLHAEGRGVKREVRGGVLFIGWKGEINAAGKDLDVLMRGGIIEFTATGRGEAVLKGRGIYRVGHNEGHWTQEGVTVQFHPSP
jgi:hypothetical protein